VTLCFEILRHTDIISTILQQRTVSASEGQNVAQLTVTTLQKLRNDDANEDFSNKLDSTLDSVDVSERALPWRRKITKRFNTGSAPYDYRKTPKDMYRPTFYEAFDLVLNCIQYRLDQPEFRVYKNLQDVFCAASRETARPPTRRT